MMSTDMKDALSSKDYAQNIQGTWPVQGCGHLGKFGRLNAEIPDLEPGLGPGDFMPAKITIISVRKKKP